MKINILFENKDLMVINKPAGVSVHGDGKTKEKTIADWILENYPKIKNVGEPLEVEYKGEKIKILKPGIVHRLDKETSGVLLIAKNKKTFEFLKGQFINREIKKIYRAFVYGNVTDPKASLATNKRGVINVPIGRSPKDIRAWTAGRGAKPPLREAITEYVVLKRFGDPSSPTKVGAPPLGRGGKDNNENLFSYLEVYPKTGRTHQIRVHMRYINHPVVSDPLYRGSHDLALGMKRLALHAFSVSFKLPVCTDRPNSETIKVEAPLPKDFEAVIKKYKFDI